MIILPFVSKAWRRYGIYALMLISIPANWTMSRKFYHAEDNLDAHESVLWSATLQSASDLVVHKSLTSTLEQYVWDNAKEFQYNNTWSSGCSLWQKNITQFKNYEMELDQYNEKVSDFEPMEEDIRKHFIRDGDQRVCDRLSIGLEDIFAPGHLSQVGGVFTEPLLPPMRYQKICNHTWKYIFSREYLVHDFQNMCRKLKPTSRTVFIDCGASLSFRGRESPVIAEIRLYEKFGFHFDHIYGFEATPTPPEHVFNMIPDDLLDSYHWINIPVSSNPKGRDNPLNKFLHRFHEDDFVVLKVDIDTPHIELPLVFQLLEKENARLVDVFYFEHHVGINEMVRSWGPSMKGSILDSITLFRQLREAGVVAHSWI